MELMGILGDPNRGCCVGYFPLYGDGLFGADSAVRLLFFSTLQLH